jgi:type IV pilus assembly protein PilA
MLISNHFNRTLVIMTIEQISARRSARGFTLVELMVAIAIIAILSSIAVAAYNYYIKEAQETVIEETISEMHHAAAVYVTANGRLPVSMQEFGFVDRTAGMDFVLTPDPNSSSHATINVHTNGNKTPFLINLANQGRGLCWDCIPASLAGVNDADIDKAFYIPGECRTVHFSATCSQGQSGSTPPAYSVATSQPGSAGNAASVQAAKSCASNEEEILINGTRACAPKCAATEIHDPQNLLSCIPDPTRQQQPACSAAQYQDKAGQCHDKPVCGSLQEIQTAADGKQFCAEKCNQMGSHRDPADPAKCVCGHDMDRLDWSGITPGLWSCNMKCAQGEVRNATTYACEPAVPTCSATQELLNNQCVAKCNANQQRNSAGQCEYRIPSCSADQHVVTRGGVPTCVARCDASAGQIWNGFSCQSSCVFPEVWRDGVGCCNPHDNRHHNKCP